MSDSRLTETKTMAASPLLPSLILAAAGGAFAWIMLFGFLQVHGDEIGLSPDIASPAAFIVALVIAVVALVYYSRRAP